jgi:hypothetical protein
MNKDTINIDGKTYVRQDKPTVDPAEIKRTEELFAKSRRISTIAGVILAIPLALLFKSFLGWFFLFCRVEVIVFPLLIVYLIAVLL